MNMTKSLSTATAATSDDSIVTSNDTTTPAATIHRPTTTTKTSFYRRPLPESCIGFSSGEGRALLKSAMHNNGLKCFYDLIQQHSSQTEPAFCGLSTLTIALNALAVDPRQTWKGPWRWYEESMLNCCINLDQVKETGITLHTFNCLALCQGLSTKLQYVDDHKDMDKEEAVHRFRRAVQEACLEDDNDGDDTEGTGIDRVLIASYSRKVLGQTGSGHFSPIAAYDSKTDSVLILDTARFKYGAHWVKLPLLYDAMMPMDPDTNRSRGYVTLINLQASEGHCCMQHHKKRCPLPISMLLRSELNQNTARRRLKEFVESIHKNANNDSGPKEQVIQFEDIYKFCTNNGTNGKNFVWELTQPQLRPVDGDHESMTLVEQVRSLIRHLLSMTPMSQDDAILSFQPSCGAAMQDCRPNRCRTLSLAPEEAMYIVYLACLEKEVRERIVASASSSTERARLQLLGEAQLFRCAMDTCDQMPDEETGHNENCSQQCSTSESCQ
jgi:glutathione gamma-glutamylcysteinyltransferase